MWRSQDILIVLNTNCGVGDMLHHCTQPSISNFRFYDISGANATDPRLLHQFNADTHEFFLWEDPANPERALMFAGNAELDVRDRGGSPSCPFSVWDISPRARRAGAGHAVQRTARLHRSRRTRPSDADGGLHSLSVSNDGTRAYFALLTGGFAVVDVSDFAAGRPRRSPRRSRPTGTGHMAGPGAHSAIKLWNKDWAWVSDEVYGTATGARPRLSVGLGADGRHLRPDGGPR